jgi:hypothetical protein
MTLTLVREPYKKLYRRLIGKRVSRLSLEKGILRFMWNGKRFTKRVSILKRLPWIGASSREGKGVSVQRDVALKNHKYEVLVAVHETIEAEANRLGLPKIREAHLVATAAEADLAKRLHVRWTRYESYVEIEFRIQHRRK